MNTRDVIASCKLKKAPTKVVGDIEPLLVAMSTSDLPQVASYIKNNTTRSLKNQRIANAFFENFTPELGKLFLTELSLVVIEKSIDTGTDIPPSFWTWLAQQKSPDLIKDVFAWSLYAMVSQEKSEFEQNHAHQFRHAHIQHAREAKTQLISALIPRLNETCVFQWSSEDWGILKMLTEKQFASHFINYCNPGRMMAMETPQGLLALQTSFDNLPAFESAFNKFFTRNRTDYDHVCLQLTSPEGFQHSAGFLSLPATVQKEFLADLQMDFEGNEEDDEECCVLVGRYKHILNYTSDELFLKRFNDANENLIKKMHIGNEYAMSNLFDKKFALSSLHAVAEQSPHILLKLDKKMGEEIAHCLNDGMVLMEFFDNISSNTFGKILHRFPNLVHWRDEKGNSLGHWSAVFKAIEDDWFDVIVAHPSLLEHNHIGQSIRDIMQHDIDGGLLSNTDEVAQLDKIILMREMGNALHTDVSSKRKI